MINDGRNLWFDFFRGASALVVCLGHLRNAILVDYTELTHSNIALKVFYFLTSLGHQAVIVFFVLSGYFVGGAVLRTGSKFTWSDYLISRLTRLWVVLIPCLFITWMIGLIVEHNTPSVILGSYFESWHSGPKFGEYSDGFNTLWANIFFMQTIIAPVFGLNSPLWSLANEFWYYILFPLLLTVIGRLYIKNYFALFASLFSIIILIFFLPKTILTSFFIWMLGVGAYVCQFKIKLLRQGAISSLLIVAFLLFILAIMTSKLSSWSNVTLIEPDFMIGLSFAFLCLILSNVSFPETRWPLLAKYTINLSEISYSLYLSHFPLVILIASVIYQSHKFEPSPALLSQFLGFGCLLLLMGSTVWWLFESRTAFLRTKMTGLVIIISK
jgi:peptidoglycan/LPS O-acetylase OafA/YrhL